MSIIKVCFLVLCPLYKPNILNGNCVAPSWLKFWLGCGVIEFAVTTLLGQIVHNRGDVWLSLFSWDYRCWLDQNCFDRSFSVITGVLGAKLYQRMLWIFLQWNPLLFGYLVVWFSLLCLSQCWVDSWYYPWCIKIRRRVSRRFGATKSASKVFPNSGRDISLHGIILTSESYCPMLLKSVMFLYPLSGVLDNCRMAFALSWCHPFSISVPKYSGMRLPR